MKKIFCIVLTIILVAGVFGGCKSTDSKSSDAAGTVTQGEKRDFRVVAYVTAESIEDLSTFDAGHMAEVTDVILFGVADFDEKGNVVLSDKFDKCNENIRTAIGDNDVNLYINLLGPRCQDDSLSWKKQMSEQAKLHNNAFQSGKLQGNIKKLLEEKHFKGVFFDYEFTIKRSAWRVFNDFIVSLDDELGDAFSIGVSAVSWDLGMSKEARAATEFIELMSYDLWDDDGNHASMEIAKKDIAKCLKKGYEPEKIDLGVPFYARPTTEEAYWYDYKSYCDVMDENGLYKDKETGLTFSFNTKSLIKEKTSYAYDEGLAGVMIWHYACDTEYGDDDSLFGAINEVKQARAEPNSLK